MIEHFGTQLEESYLGSIEEELMSLVDQGLLEMGVGQDGEVLFWATPLGEVTFNVA